ncbi:hypothetical protein KDA_23540 [Dictyobacter alpinus]|uniref:Protein-glutamine gamma-glutamyltransferase-like C-terminal domain-containing protein n=1 Tax=Dictyobacter alpinus TaxID=2014873 RepID=A0A402B6B3_9CHLR|nr:DUF4129 domain-containing protein [Dictyobacter alpinus]GCE26870.1 hypothetical protein KDA_23540 [Dictyobacter alpinus]
MGLFKPSATDRTEPSVPARVASNWIELLAVPIASALMEAQPIYLVLQLLFRRITLAYNYLDVGSITLLLLGLHWWAIWNFYRRERQGVALDYTVGMHVTRLDILAIVSALLILGLTHWYALDDPLTIAAIIVLVGWGWKRGVDRARSGFSEDQLILAFKIGLGALLVVMGFSILGDAASDYSINNDLLRDLPLFFLSGFIALSFTRIGAVRKEQARQTHNATREGTNRWITTLTVTWVALIVLSIALEILPEDVLIMLISPLWWLIGLLAQVLFFVINVIVYVFSLAINWLLSLLPHFNGNLPPTPRTPTHPSNLTTTLQKLAQQQHGSATTMLILRLLVMVGAIALLIAMVYFVRRRQKNSEENTLPEEEELREGLNAQQIRKERRQEHRQRQQDMLDADGLAPDSVRYRYRSLLQAMAEKGGEFARQQQETPLEYQKRLLLLATPKLPAGEGEQPTDPAILAELTQAYARERYGGKKLEDERQNYLRQWVPQLLARLTTYLTTVPQPTKKRPYQPSRWGED